MEARRPVRPGDFLILVRQRGALFEALIRALKDARIEVAGADRLLLAEHIVVMDLMALADALLLPSDDLALATVLRSPLIGISEEDLFTLAWKRSGTLRAELRTKAPNQPAFADAAEKLDRWADAARRETPFAFYARLLGAEGGRARILKRLGPEAGDALDEFLNLALDYETRETPSLHGFVAQLRTTASEVKRDMEIARDEVRVMTVHGAKGLEAPVVILADTTTRPAGPRDPRLLALAAEGGAPGTPHRLVWAQAAKTDVAPVAAARMQARNAAENEHRRLLYVAMTRAADRLIVCGAQGENKPQQGCWYDLVHAALSPLAQEGVDSDGQKFWRLQKLAGEQAELPLSAQISADMTPSRKPKWLFENVRAEPAVQVLRPSAALEEVHALRAMRAAPGENRQQALLHGSVLHRLMQSLPDIPREYRAAAARRYLAQAGSGLSESERETVMSQALAVLAHPRFAALTGPESRAEVPIVGRLAGADGSTILVSGQIDRLAVTNEAVLIADYKTNHPAPRRLEDVPQSYVTQLALYRAVLARLYPDRAISALLVWTQVPDFMEVPDHALETALSVALGR
jgi:ATP-dependent helicase/nuclease subunit A